jgi:hypothetical protein
MHRTFVLAVGMVFALAAPGSGAPVRPGAPCPCLVICPTGITNGNCLATVKFSLKGGKKLKAVNWYVSMQIGAAKFCPSNTMINCSNATGAKLIAMGKVPAGKSKVTITVNICGGGQSMNTVCVCFQMAMCPPPPAPTPASGAEKDNGGEEEASINDFLCPGPLKYPVRR